VHVCVCVLVEYKYKYIYPSERGSLNDTAHAHKPSGWVEY